LGNFQLVTPHTTPTKTTSLTVYAHARAILRPSSTSALTGRNAERAVITSFLQGKDENKEKTCLYISGTPGTGKTFLVNDVIIGLKLKSKYLNCNGMGVEDIKSVARQTRDEKKNSKDTISYV
jgi:cell division control protein 6